MTKAATAIYWLQ